MTIHEIKIETESIFKFKRNRRSRRPRESLFRRRRDCFREDPKKYYKQKNEKLVTPVVMSVVSQSKAVQKRGTQALQKRGDQQTGTTTESYKRIHMLMMLMVIMMMRRRRMVMMMTHLLDFSYLITMKK